jgi:hypothetical protein
MNKYFLAMLNPTIEICTRGVDVHSILTGCVYVFVAINIPTLPICGSCAAKTDQCGFVFWANELSSWGQSRRVRTKYHLSTIECGAIKATIQLCGAKLCG